ncbi:LysR substrate-binding domain-containing protein [Paraburkholderia solisilvae]|uniref:Hydrogen peroxide-inducible genes activator n=1 Tax=Paraburkholderia solisilvae TaxID=624376 RepID=A0A6J5EPE6_9BURK|nr:LysR substrate-binding domain-containing protein [Paraburkholderia solisilvae]CAB3767607.1 Hydrogen peroxide-inducible genes activator [Paraburkholderia solisilvae]
MDIRQLKYFVAIIDAGSFSKAAERLFVAQPSLSQQMAGLESELKTKLLIRSAQGVAPTTAGSALYRHARVVLRQMEQIRNDVREDSGSEAGSVAVGLPTTVAVVLALPLFERIRKRFPGIRLQIVEGMSGSISEMLPNGRLDLALLFRDSETRGISVIPVFDEELYVFGHAGLALRKSNTTCPLAALANVPIVAPSAANGLRLVIERTFQRAEVELNIVADIDSLPTLVAIATEGSACTILPASALAQREPAARPVMRKIVQPAMTRPVSVCWSHAVPISAAALAVRKAIVELIRELHAHGKWTGITLRPAPDQATLAGTGGPAGSALVLD